MECRYCYSTNLIEKLTENGPHYAELRCADCGRHLQWIPKPKNEKETKRNNNKWLKKWREKLEVLICHWCWIKETETKMGFEIDHISPIEEGGQDEFENTRPLCSACHWLRNAERHRVKYLKLAELDRQQMYEDYLEDLKSGNDDEEVPF